MDKFTLGAIAIFMAFVAVAGFATGVVFEVALTAILIMLIAGIILTMASDF
jgi:hypothetical protein